MSHERAEITQWLRRNGQTPQEIEAVLCRLDRFDDQVSRESIFDDIALGEFDLRPTINEALAADDPPAALGVMHREEDVFLQGAFVI
jgi:hypothetical protein